jgi:hypothetical protein
MITAINFFRLSRAVAVAEVRKKLYHTSRARKLKFWLSQLGQLDIPHTQNFEI